MSKKRKNNVIKIECWSVIGYGVEKLESQDQNYIIQMKNYLDCDLPTMR